MDEKQTGTWQVKLSMIPILDFSSKVHSLINDCFVLFNCHTWDFCSKENVKIRFNDVEMRISIFKSDVTRFEHSLSKINIIG